MRVLKLQTVYRDVVADLSSSHFHVDCVQAMWKSRCFPMSMFVIASYCLS